MSNCSKCGSYSFEMVEAHISGTRFPYMFIQCASCGSVVGVSETHYVPEVIRETENRLRR
jgi:predicted nucleic-acid-binding Zn-ribbon protein